MTDANIGFALYHPGSSWALSSPTTPRKKAAVASKFAVRMPRKQIRCTFIAVFIAALGPSPRSSDISEHAHPKLL